MVIRDFWIPDDGVIETAPVSDLKTALVIAASVAAPVFWTLGVTIGHRFNERCKSSISFIAHLLQVTFFTMEFSGQLAIGKTQRNYCQFLLVFLWRH
jgi:hypothetical protein